jgi:alpha-methylacyl-CoA racemase
MLTVIHAKVPFVMGPLSSLRIVELAGLGPGPFCGMMLSDLGADVLRVERPAAWDPNRGLDPRLVLTRGRRSVAVDLKHERGVETVLRLVDAADGLIEGYRPGVTERLGLGPDVCLARNPRLVYGRITGWGQEGPLASTAGHDIDYIAIAGALAPVGEKGSKPIPPLNMLGDFGGGGMLLAFGMLAALVEARESGHGQVVDAAMVDGAALLTTMVQEMMGQGAWLDQRGSNPLDTGSHFYNTYETADGEYVAVGAVEPQFYAELLRRLELDGDADFSDNQLNTGMWPELIDRMAKVFRTKTRDEWVRVFEGSDACFAPVLSMREAQGHEHNRVRRTFVDVAGIIQPAPAPRFGRTPAGQPGPPPGLGEHTRQALVEWGFSDAETDELFGCGAVA